MSESSERFAQGTAARVGLKALKVNTQRSIKRMVSVGPSSEAEMMGEGRRGDPLDVLQNRRAGDKMVVRNMP